MEFRTTRFLDFRKFNCRRLFNTLIREFHDADNIEFLAHIVDDMKHNVDLFSALFTGFGFKISLSKTKVMLTTVTSEPVITVHDTS